MGKRREPRPVKKTNGEVMLHTLHVDQLGSRPVPQRVPIARAGGAVENGVQFFTSASCHHRPEIYGGLGEATAGELLKDFFKQRR